MRNLLVRARDVRRSALWCWWPLLIIALLLVLPAFIIVLATVFMLAIPVSCVFIVFYNLEALVSLYNQTYSYIFNSKVSYHRRDAIATSDQTQIVKLLASKDILPLLTNEQFFHENDFGISHQRNKDEAIWSEEAKRLHAPPALQGSSFLSSDNISDQRYAHVNERANLAVVPFYISQQNYLGFCTDSSHHEIVLATDIGNEMGSIHTWQRIEKKYASLVGGKQEEVDSSHEGKRRQIEDYTESEPVNTTFEEVSFLLDKTAIKQAQSCVEPCPIYSSAANSLVEDADNVNHENVKQDPLVKEFDEMPSPKLESSRLEFLETGLDRKASAISNQSLAASESFHVSPPIGVVIKHRSPNVCSSNDNGNQVLASLPSSICTEFPQSPKNAKLQYEKASECKSASPQYNKEVQLSSQSGEKNAGVQQKCSSEDGVSIGIDSGGGREVKASRDSALCDMLNYSEDGEAYTVLLHTLVPASCDLSSLDEKCLLQRPKAMLPQADHMKGNMYLSLFVSYDCEFKRNGGCCRLFLLNLEINKRRICIQLSTLEPMCSICIECFHSNITHPCV